MTKKTKEQDATTLCAVLCYFIVGIVWYFLDEKMKKNAFVAFHARQGLALVLASIIASVGIGILSLLLILTIPFIVWLVHVAVWLTMLVLWIMGILSAVNGQKKEIPILGEFAQKLSF